MKIKSLIVKVLKQSPSLDLFLRRFRCLFIRLKYRLMYRDVNVINNTFLFESYHGRSASGSPLAIYKEVRKALPHAKCIWVFTEKNKDDFIRFSQEKNTECVIRRSKEFHKACLSSQYLIMNSRTPFWIVPRKEQILLQCWHGTPLKKLGCDMDYHTHPTSSMTLMHYAYRLESKKCRFFVSPSPYATKHFKSAFELPDEKILELGYPRNDALVINKDNEKYINSIKQKLNISLDKKIILYAPTYRDYDHTLKDGFVQSNQLDSLAFKKFVKENNYIVLFRGHYFTEPESGSAFLNVSDYSDINDLLLISDILITDYSSMFFDYLNLERPMYFYMYDKNRYLNETHGGYLDVDKELPGPVCETEEELREHLNKIGNVADFDYKAFNQIYNPYEDGKSASRVLQHILKTN